MSDKELLKLAAKAAGVELQRAATGDRLFTRTGISAWQEWNPLTDDSDALQLAVKLGLLGAPSHVIDFVVALGDKDPYAATRRAIVRAAAEIGKRRPVMSDIAPLYEIIEQKERALTAANEQIKQTDDFLQQLADHTQEVEAALIAERAISDKLEKVLMAVINLDDGDSPDLWHYEAEFATGRNALAEVAAMRDK